MKRVAMFIAGIALAVSAMAEASFQQIEGLIEQKNYAAAAAGLEGIIQNHPKSAKAFYAMAQAQAGLGNLEKAQYALNKAKSIDPDLKFASCLAVYSACCPARTGLAGVTLLPSVEWQAAQPPGACKYSLRP